MDSCPSSPQAFGSGSEHELPGPLAEDPVNNSLFPFPLLPQVVYVPTHQSYMDFLVLSYAGAGAQGKG